MAEVKAADVAALRKATGAGMMDCKRALEDADGDLEKAVDLLRIKGLGTAGKLSERQADEGAVDVVVDHGVAAIVELNCNTDFVAKGADFQSTLEGLTKLVADHGDGDLAAEPFADSTVADALVQLAAKLGENVSLGRVVRIESDGLLDAYKHIQSGRGVNCVVVDLGGVDPADERARDVAHEIALHIAWARPEYLTRDDVPADVVEREREVLTEKSRAEGVPEARIEGAVQGRVNAFFKEKVLLDQPSTKDPKVSIRQLVEGLGAGATVRRFARVEIGAD